MAVDGCGIQCAKWSLFIFNFIFFLCGCALLGVGIYVQIELSDYFNFFSIQVNAPAIVIIVVGAITLIVGFLGCCGAVREHRCMIMTFAVLISLILIIEIGGGIAAFVLKGQVNKIVTDGMMSSMGNYGKNESKGVTSIWDSVQKKFKCCGTNNASDWEDTKFGKLPTSCCVNVTTCSTTKLYHENGCLPEIENLLSTNIGYVAGTAIGLAVVEVMGIILACCLYRTLKRQSDYA